MTEPAYHNPITEGLKQIRDKVTDLAWENTKYKLALKSIAANGCCKDCQEARFIALGALANHETREIE